MLTYEAMCGEDVHRSAREMAKLAMKKFTTVRCNFNGVAMTCMPGDTPEDVVAQWDAEMQKCRERARQSALDEARKAHNLFASLLDKASLHHDFVADQWVKLQSYLPKVEA